MWGRLVITGSINRTLDAKKRFAFPKRWRETLVDSDAVYLAPGPDRCLQIHSRSSLDKFARQLSDLRRPDQSTRDFQRLFYGRSESCPVDSQGRIRVPQRLLTWAELAANIVLVGVGSHVEIWDENRWESFLDSHRDDYDSMIQRVLSGDSPTRSESQPPAEEKRIPR